MAAVILGWATLLLAIVIVRLLAALGVFVLDLYDDARGGGPNV